MRENYASELRVRSRCEFPFLTQSFAYRKLVENHSVEGEVLVVYRVQGAPHHPCLDFVLLVRQELQLYIRVAEGREDRGSP